VLIGECKTRDGKNLKMKYVTQISMSAFIEKSFTLNDNKKSNIENNNSTIIGLRLYIQSFRLLSKYFLI